MKSNYLALLVISLVSLTAQAADQNEYSHVPTDVVSSSSAITIKPS